MIFCGLVFLIGAIHARRKLMRRTAIGRGGCPRGYGSAGESAEALRALATPIRPRGLEPLDIAAAILVPAIVFLCWALLTLLVIAHERETERRDGREAETESLTRT
jgi:hypothetical protein